MSETFQFPLQIHSLPFSVLLWPCRGPHQWTPLFSVSLSGPTSGGGGSRGSVGARELDEGIWLLDPSRPGLVWAAATSNPRSSHRHQGLSDLTSKIYLCRSLVMPSLWCVCSKTFDCFLGSQLDLGMNFRFQKCPSLVIRVNGKAVRGSHKINRLILFWHPSL